MPAPRCGRTRLQQQAPLVPGVQRAAAVVCQHAQPQLLPASQRGRQRRQHLRAHFRIADADDAAAPQHAAHLPQGGEGVAEVEEHGVGERGVERGVGEREVVDAGHREGDVRHALPGGQRVRRHDLAWVQVDAEGLPGRHRRGQADRDGAGAAPAVQDAHPGPQVRQEERALPRRGPARQLRVERGAMDVDFASAQGHSLPTAARLLRRVEGSRHEARSRSCPQGGWWTKLALPDGLTRSQSSPPARGVSRTART